MNYKFLIDRVCPSNDICGTGECVVTSHPLDEYQFACKCKDGSYKFEPCSSNSSIIDEPAGWIY